MKKLSRICCLLIALMLTMSAAFAETAPQDEAVALVNGEPLLYSAYSAVETSQIVNYANAGYDVSDPVTAAYIQDMALSVAIENMLIEQDMRAQGCYDYDEEMENWFVQQGTAAYEEALSEVGEMLRQTLELDEETDMSSYALAYAEGLGVTVESYIDVYRTQYAYIKYYEWLNGGETVSDEDVLAEYEARVEQSRTRYENDAAAFETAVNTNQEVWYKPAGYRSILQILLAAEGETADEKLASVQDTVSAITARIENGEDYKTLIAEYTMDAAFGDESFYEVGYQVHRDSVIWEKEFVDAAFSEEMAQPGSWSKPFASKLGVHILYYLSDSEAGAVEMTDAIHDALAYEIYSVRSQTRLSERLDELADTAEIVIY